MSRPRIHDKPKRVNIMLDEDDLKKGRRLAKERKSSLSAVLAEMIRTEFSKPRE